MKKKKKHKKKSTSKKVVPCNYYKWNIPAAVVKIYLIPLAKIGLLLWLIISGKLLTGLLLYILFGIYKLISYYKNIKSTFNPNWIEAIPTILLWPAIDVFTFIPPKNTDLD